MHTVFEFSLEQLLYVRIQENIQRVLDQKYTRLRWHRIPDFKNDVVKCIVCF